MRRSTATPELVPPLVWVAATAGLLLVFCIGVSRRTAPFQPFILAGIHWVFGVSSVALVAVLLVKELDHAATAVLAYSMARRMVAARTAGVVSALIALHPFLIRLAANTEYLDRRASLSLPLESMGYVR